MKDCKYCRGLKIDDEGRDCICVDNIGITQNTMNQKEYLELFKKECEEQYNTTLKKNSDYAGENTNNAFFNFELVEHMSKGKITTEMGMYCRMTDKMSRIINLMFQKNCVESEGLADALQDLSVYAKMMKIYIESKK